MSTPSRKPLVPRVRRRLDRLRVGGVVQARERLWSSTGWLDLRADLAALPARRTARVQLTMEPCTDDHFTGFEDEAARVSGADLEQVRSLQHWFEAGLRQLHVAWSDGQPAYCQWLIGPAELPIMAEANPAGTYDPLAPGEVLLEGAYTFQRARGQGAMADCMGQLLRIAEAQGARTAFTCVGDDNVPSLKGCRRVGFEADRLRVTDWRLGRRRTSVRPGGEAPVWQSIA